MNNRLTLIEELEIIKLKNEKIMTNKNIMCKYNIKSIKTIYDIINRNGREKIIANKKYNVNENYFKHIDTEDKAYWLGFLYADGYVRIIKNRSGELKLKLKKSDRNHIELFKKCIETTVNITEHISKVTVNEKTYYSEIVQIIICNTKIVKNLFEHGCFNNKTFKITLPKLDDNLMVHFIRGYFDGDGCISKRNNNNNNYTISFLGNEIFINQLRNYLIENCLNNERIYINNHGSIKKLNISYIENCRKIKNYLYGNSTIYLKRKKDIFDSISNLL